MIRMDLMNREERAEYLALRETHPGIVNNAHSLYSQGFATHTITKMLSTDENRAEIHSIVWFVCQFAA